MASPRLTVTQLRCACLSREWLEAWLAGKNPPVRAFSPSGSGVVFGQKFHQIADGFTTWLTEAGSQPKTEPLKDADALWEEMYDRFAGTALTEIAASGRVAESMALKERLHSFCGQLATLRGTGPGFKSWGDLLLVSEHTSGDVPFHLRKTRGLRFRADRCGADDPGK